MTESEKQQIRKVFLSVANKAKTKNPAFFNWDESKIDSALQNYQFIWRVDSSGQINSFICYQDLGGAFEILSLGVEPAAQKQGCMHRLLSDFCAMRKDMAIFLEVHEDNFPAIALYQKLGFALQRRRKQYYVDGKDALVLGLQAPRI